MKRLISIVLCLALLANLALFLTACGSDDDDIITIRIGASPVPHAEILNYIAPYLLEEGIRLEIVEFTEFALPNPGVSDGSLDANYFQHMPFLENYMNATNNELHNVGFIHIEPMGAYSMTLNHINELPVGATVAFPDCAVNGPRALLLLQTHGLITLNPYAGFFATTQDIVDNPLDLQFITAAASFMPTILLANEADLSIINTNHLLFGAPAVCPEADSLIRETTDSPYANMLVSRPENANDAAILAILRHLQSERVREFILENYRGVVPVF